jgi:DNA polymerase I
LEKQLAPVIADMTIHGMHFDKLKAKDLAVITEAKAAEAEKKLRDWLGLDPTYIITNPQKLLEAFQAKELAIDNVQEPTLKAAESEGADLALAWKHILNKELKFVNLLSESTRPDGRIHAIYNPTGTVTGRFSSKDPNLQQIPRGDAIRGLFTAPDGRSLVIADFAQMELVIAVIVAGEEVMLKAFRDGVDVHKLTGSLVTGTPIDQVTKRQRQMAKAVNFGLLCGQQAKGFRIYAKDKYEIDLSLEQAEDLRNKFFEAYPSLVAWHTQARQDAESYDQIDEVRTKLGRRQFIAGREWWPRFTALVNTPIQGGCADITKLVMVELARRLRGVAQLVNVVHDEVLLETKTEDAERVEKIVGETMVEMTQAIYPAAPMGAEVVSGKRWSDKK